MHFSYLLGSCMIKFWHFLYLKNHSTYVNGWLLTIIAPFPCLMYLTPWNPAIVTEKWNFAHFLYCYKYRTDEGSLILGRHFPQIYGKRRFRLICSWYLATIALHPFTETQKNHLNSFGVLGPNFPKAKHKEYCFFQKSYCLSIWSFSCKRIEKSLNCSVIFDDVWGDKVTDERDWIDKTSFPSVIKNEKNP